MLFGYGESSNFPLWIRRNCGLPPPTRQPPCPCPCCPRTSSSATLSCSRCTRSGSHTDRPSRRGSGPQPERFVNFFSKLHNISFPCIPRIIPVFMCSYVGLIFWQILIVAGECVYESRGKCRAKVGRRRRFAPLLSLPFFSSASSIRGWTVLLSLSFSLSASLTERTFLSLFSSSV